MLFCPECTVVCCHHTSTLNFPVARRTFALLMGPHFPLFSHPVFLLGTCLPPHKVFYPLKQTSLGNMSPLCLASACIRKVFVISDNITFIPQPRKAGLLGFSCCILSLSYAQ